MKNIDKLVYAVACLGLVACNSNKKIEASKSNKPAEPFSVKKINADNRVISINYNKEDIKCKSPCQLYKTQNFLKLTNANIDVLYNRKGKIISQSDNSKSKIELTDSFAKVTSDSKTTIYSGFTGAKLFEDSVSDIKLSDKFLVSLNKNLKIYNIFGQLLEDVNVTDKKVDLHISNNFVGYTLAHKSLVLYGGNNHKLANYNYREKHPMRIQLNNNFAYYSIGKNIGVLHGQKGQKLMNFAGRPAQAVYMNENVGGFYDISESASFWRSNGSHIISLVKEPGLEVSQINNQIEYRTKKNNRYKKLN